MGGFWLICSSFATSYIVSSARVQLDSREEVLSGSNALIQVDPPGQSASVCLL